MPDCHKSRACPGSSGTNRTYILSLPGNYDRSHAYRLMFGLHWLNGTANDVYQSSHDPQSRTAAR